VKPAGQLILRAGARLYAPLIVLFALAVLAAPAADVSRGLSAGLALALAFALHVIVAGAQAGRGALPAWLLRAALVAGLAACCAAIIAPGWSYGGFAAVCGMALAALGALGLALSVLAGRASALRDEEW
jgi:hypothetical protein